MQNQGDPICIAEAAASFSDLTSMGIVEDYDMYLQVEVYHESVLSDTSSRAQKSP